MSCASDGSECQRTSAAGDADSTVTDLPVAKRLRDKFLLAGPLEFQRHFLVSNLDALSDMLSSRRTEQTTYPVADPVVRTDVDEHAHAPLQECTDIQLSGEHLVKVQVELAVDVHVAGREVRSQRRVDTDRLADVGAVEE